MCIRDRSRREEFRVVMGIRTRRCSAPNGGSPIWRKSLVRRTMLSLVAVLLLTAVPVVADHGDQGDWEFGVYGGYGWLDDYGPFNPKDDWLYGARIGYFFTSRWNMAVSYTHLRAHETPEHLV